MKSYKKKYQDIKKKYFFQQKGGLYYENGDRYEGEMNIDNQRNGIGKMYYTNGEIYEGKWKNDKKDGIGKMYYTNGDMYEGDWINDKKNGIGKMIWSDKASYEGEYVNDKREGIGTIIFPDSGSISVAYFKNGIRDGFAIAEINDGKIKCYGNYTNDKMNGIGQIYNEGENSTIYKGDVENDMKHGVGKIMQSDGFIYEGQFFRNNRIFAWEGKRSFDTELFKDIDILEYFNNELELDENYSELLKIFNNVTEKHVKPAKH